MRTATLMKPFIIILILILSIPHPLFAQKPTRRPAPRPINRPTQISDNVIADLLAMQPLTPEEEETTQNANEADAKPPADNAPMKELIEYWSNRSDVKPSEIVQQRLLEAVLNRPEMIVQLRHALPNSSAAYDQIYQIMQEESDSPEDAYWKGQARRFLQSRSQYFREDLLAEARSDDFNERHRALFVLAKVDWDAAKPIVEQMIGGTNIDAMALALGIQRKHALNVGETSQAESALTKLKEMVGNRQLPHTARSRALSSVMESEWQGQEEWVLNLFADPTLSGIITATTAPPTSTEQDNQIIMDNAVVISTPKGSVSSATMTAVAAAAAVARAATSKGIPGGAPDGVFGEPVESLLVSALQSNYDKWIPKVIPLVGNADRNIHNAAVKFLVAINNNPEPDEDKTLTTNRKDAARALLPWLTNPSWASISNRAEFIESLQQIELPDAVPGLLTILDSETERAIVDAAVRVLQEYKDARAVGSLKRLLQKEATEVVRDPIITAIALCGGFSDEEMATMFEAFARKNSSDAGAEEIGRALEEDKILPLNISIGRVLYESQEIPATEGLAIRLFARAKELRFKEPAVARMILSGIHFAPLQVAKLNLLERIGTGNVDVTELSFALENRRDWQKSVAEAIYPLLTQGGYAAGIAAVLLGEAGRQTDILEGKDTKAQLALLTAARHVREQLPVTAVAPLLNNALLTKAAESYLEIENSAAARNLIWARHPKQAWIVGEGITIDAQGGGEYSHQKLEKKLQQEVLAQNGKLEIYAALTKFYGAEGEENGNIIIRVQNDEAEISLPNRNSYRAYRKLTPNELQDLKSVTAKPEIEDLGPEFYYSKNNEGDDGPWHAYLRLNQENGRRVSFYSLRRAPKKDATPHEELAGLFYTLSRTGDFKIRYELEDKIPGLEVLLTNSKHKLQTVAQEGNEVRVLVEEVEKQPSQNKGIFPYVWRAFENGQLGGIVFAPTALADSFETAKAFLSIEFLRSPVSNFAAPQILPKQKIAYSAVPFGKEPGIWKIPVSSNPIKVREGSYFKVVVTPDETWAVAGKLPKQGEKQSSSLVRLNLQTGEEFTVTAPADTRLWAQSFLPLQNRILLSDKEPFGYASNDGKFFLLDPTTGKLQAVKGEFRPLHLSNLLLLQPTRKPNEVWVPLYDLEKGDCSIGRYNLATFTFTPVIKLSGLRLSHLEMWVDETAGKIYFIHDGNLLRVPLPK